MNGKKNSILKYGKRGAGNKETLCYLLQDVMNCST